MSEAKFAADIAKLAKRMAQDSARTLLKEARDKIKAKTDARKADDKMKYDMGGLVKLAGLANTDKGLLLGALLTLADTLTDTKNPKSSEQRAQWKTTGDTLLAQREKIRTSQRA